MNSHSIAHLIKEYYPQYWGIQTYPKDECITIHKVDEPWGLLGNFARTPIVYSGVTFRNTEQLYQCLKFKDEETIRAVYNANNPKMTAKHWETTHRREDWGCILIDAMKLCLSLKFEQHEEFRNMLLLTKGKYIVEDQTSMPKKNPDAWGVKPNAINAWSGPNILGRLLMELRDNGHLDFNLPKDVPDTIAVLRHN